MLVLQVKLHLNARLSRTPDDENQHKLRMNPEKVKTGKLAPES